MNYPSRRYNNDIIDKNTFDISYVKKNNGCIKGPL